MRGAESSKWFMSYEIYFKLEYYYLWSNCNGWAWSAHNNNLVYNIWDITWECVAWEWFLQIYLCKHIFAHYNQSIYLSIYKLPIFHKVLDHIYYTIIQLLAAFSLFGSQIGKFNYYITYLHYWNILWPSIFAFFSFFPYLHCLSLLLPKNFAFLGPNLVSLFTYCIIYTTKIFFGLLFSLFFPYLHCLSLLLPKNFAFLGPNLVSLFIYCISTLLKYSLTFHFRFFGHSLVSSTIYCISTLLKYFLAFIFAFFSPFLIFPAYTQDFCYILVPIWWV